MAIDNKLAIDVISISVPSTRSKWLSSIIVKCKPRDSAKIPVKTNVVSRATGMSTFIIEANRNEKPKSKKKVWFTDDIWCTRPICVSFSSSGLRIALNVIDISGAEDTNPTNTL